MPAGPRERRFSDRRAFEAFVSSSSADAVPLLGTDDVDPGQTVVQVDGVPIAIEVDRRNVRIRMMPGGVDHDTVNKDVGLAVTGELVGLGEVAVETVRGIGVQERVDVLHDDGLGVDAAGPDVRELPAVLR